VFCSQRCSCPGVRRLGSEAGHWYQSSAEMKNEWSYTYAPTTCFNGMDRKNFPKEIMHQTALPNYFLQRIKTVFRVMEAANIFVSLRLFYLDFNPVKLFRIFPRSQNRCRVGAPISHCTAFFNISVQVLTPPVTTYLLHGAESLLRNQLVCS